MLFYVMIFRSRDCDLLRCRAAILFANYDKTLYIGNLKHMKLEDGAEHVTVAYSDILTDYITMMEKPLNGCNSNKNRIEKY